MCLILTLEIVSESRRKLAGNGRMWRSQIRQAWRVYARRLRITGVVTAAQAVRIMTSAGHAGRHIGGDTMSHTLRKLFFAVFLVGAALLATRQPLLAEMSCDYEQFRCEGGGWNGTFILQDCQTFGDPPDTIICQYYCDPWYGPGYCQYYP